MRLVPKSVLFVPGNRPDMFEKAAIAPAGAIFPDMEDAVPFREKLAARHDIAANLERLGSGGAPVIPRLNSLYTGLFDEDLEAHHSACTRLCQHLVLLPLFRSSRVPAVAT